MQAAERSVANSKTKVKSYKDLLVWQKGIKLAKNVYQLTQAFPDAERFGLVSQMRRAAISIPCNIAEGQARHTRKEFIQFLSHSEGSVAELETQLILGRRVRLLRVHRYTRGHKPGHRVEQNARFASAKARGERMNSSCLWLATCHSPLATPRCG